MGWLQQIGAKNEWSIPNTNSCGEYLIFYLVSFQSNPIRNSNSICPLPSDRTSNIGNIDTRYQGIIK